MGRPFQFQLDDRRETVRYFRDQGMTPREIARKLKSRIEVIERDLKAIEEEDIREIEEERLREAVELEKLKLMGVDLEMLKRTVMEALEEEEPQPAPVSRGPRRSNKEVSKRRAIVLKLRYRGIKQREIARMLNTPLRTIQADYASLRKRHYEILKAYEIAIRERLRRLSVFTDEEVVEVFLGSPERTRELWERPQDGAVRFDLKWVRRRK